MLRDNEIEVASTWAQGDENGASYREIDRQLRRIAKSKGRLEIEEARWLREAERLRVWRKVGFSTALEYLEDVFGYAPRTAMERLRVAKDLGELPALEEQVKSGALPWSAARELTRVMTPANETSWLERARGKNLRDIELLVAGRKKGDAPDAPPDPALMTRTLVLKIVPRVDALWQQVGRVFEDERGEHIDEVDLFEAVCRRALAASSLSSSGTAVPSVLTSSESSESAVSSVLTSSESSGSAVSSVLASSELSESAVSSVRNRQPEQGRASVMRANGKAPKPLHRIVTQTCDECMRGWREGRGRVVEVSRADIELARCDAEVVRGLQAAELADVGRPDSADAAGRHVEERVPRTKDGKVRTKRRPPPTLTIPKATRDFVWKRDQGRCRVPGCRATHNLECHHLEFLSRGGNHDPANLVLLCDGHHTLLHEGLLVITGRAPDQLTFVRNGRLLVDARSAAELEVSNKLRVQGTRVAQESVSAPPTRSRFDNVVKVEQVKQALRQLKFTARAARAAAEAACAHVGGDADIGTLVKTALELERRRAASGAGTLQSAQTEVHIADAKQALVQLGYPATVAAAAVHSARAHVAATSDLVTLIKEALRRCSST